jgi:hypothetical protein
MITKMILSLFLLGNLAQAEDKLLAIDTKKDEGPVGYLKETWYVPDPISFNQATTMTYHYHNLSAAPLRLEGLNKYIFTPMCLWVKVAAKGVTDKQVYDRWGPPTVEDFTFCDLRADHRMDRVLISGHSLERMHYLHEEPDRALVLFNGEGYARKFTLLPGWAGKEEVQKVPLGSKWLVIQASSLLPVSSPVLKPDACQPGKPIQWGAPKRVVGLGPCLVPFQPHLGAAPKQPDVAPDLKSGLVMELQPPVQPDAEKSMELTYIIGNAGKEPIFIEQNSASPALAEWSLLQSTKEIAKGDGGDLRAILELYPAREAFLLLPGEYLSFRRNFTDSELAWKNGADYELKVRLPAVRFRKPDATEFSTVELSAPAKLQPRKIKH